MSKSPMCRIGRRTGLLLAGLFLALPSGLAVGVLGGASVASATVTQSQTFTFSDATQYFTVPADIYSVGLTASGGTGGGGDGVGGAGAQITESVPVEPGDTLVVEVGGAGAPSQSNGTDSPGGAGGLSSGDAMNGGAGGGVDFVVDGDSGGGGGGGTEVVDATTGSLLVVAGGGGGAGGNGNSSTGNSGNGGPGGSAVDSTYVSTGSQGSAPYGGQGGAGGLGAATGVPAGADGGTPETGELAGGGGGGGGGYAGNDDGGGNGGAGGGWVSYQGGGGGGGGGDSFVPSVATSIGLAANRAGNGQVTIAWNTPPAPTTTSLSATPDSVAVGQSYTLTATVAGTDSVPATGSVTFTGSDGETVVSMLSGTDPDVASATVTAPDTTGSVTWQAQYGGVNGAPGQPDEAPSNSPIFSETVNTAPTSTTVRSSKDPLTTGQSYTVTATVAGTGPTTPTGTVDFYRTAGPTLTGTLSGGTPDVATVTTTAPTSPGTVAWAAQYEGDATNAGSAAPTIEVPVKGPVPKPTLAAASPPSGVVGTKVTLSGKNLGGTTMVLFGTKGAKVFSCASATTCTAVAPKGVSGKVDLQVVTAAGTSKANPKVTFTYEGKP